MERRRVKGFDFLRDTLPDGLETLRYARFPRSLRPVLTASVALLAVAVAAAGLEASRLHEALLVQARAQERFEQSRAAVADLRLQAGDLEALFSEDRRLRSIRLSGATVGGRLATLGNLFPRHVWLTSMSADPNGYALRGRAGNLAALASLLANLSSDHRTNVPRTVSISRSGRQNAFYDFEVDAGAHR
jgi:Tfp pilus assembly protein PilN